ncbi:MAG: ypdA 5, partial [Bacteroidota bacterium]|nr:ypdA 5 [Bacteroidota bacterium]
MGFAVSIITQLLVAQVANYNFNSNVGLPSNETYCIFQDKAGYMWFGTDHGVVRYNGYTFKTFTNAEGLTDNTVFSIKEDDNGRLWFMTFNGGICYFDGSRFVPHPLNDSIIKICYGKMPVSFEVTNNNTVWMGFVQWGFYKIEANKIKSFLVEHHDTAGPATALYVL